METSIEIGIGELEDLNAWIEKMDPKPRVIKIINTPTGIGVGLRAEVVTQDGEGRWKDLTDYENW